MVPSVAVYDDQSAESPIITRLQDELIALLLAKALKHKTIHRPWLQLVRSRDQATASRLDMKKSPI